MSDQFSLTGSYTVTPMGAVYPSLDPEINATIYEQIQLGAKQFLTITIPSTDPIAVPFGTLSRAHVVIINSTGEITARLTSVDGSEQAVPIDSAFVLMSSASPITAISLTGAGVLARVFLGQKAA